ncbi:DUF1836 domain-containing protein [Ectobacillus ponti]|uniref:DUF1836 domain-containing protein n=1 Tax=Ectobacillus ponti TaxID=2961894 RepID=A0AA41XD92_9BACI|nr:DUF1836 domain-containing protein [Ectobacillus ponti]MCP8970755.1 DUF1836 domain-containing protein [Ectobacillus ponti]
MQTFQLTRKEMADLLLSLKGWSDKKPLAVLQGAWMKQHHADVASGETAAALTATALPPIFEKIMKSTHTDMGFSLNEIVALGNQVENTAFSVTAVQNWVKRDIKDIIGSPQRGKKYSIEQTALLFMVEDLKTALDFESIRKLLQLIVNDPSTTHDDLISPVRLYACYSFLFEEVNQNGPAYITQADTVQSIETVVKAKAAELAATFTEANDDQREAIRNAIIIAALSVHTSYFQMLARRYVSATLFLQNLHV